MSDREGKPVGCDACAAKDKLIAELVTALLDATRFQTWPTPPPAPVADWNKVTC